MDKTKILIVCFLLAVVGGRSGLIAQDANPRAEELIKIDRAFSYYSTKHGMNEAFIMFADSSAVLLKPNMMPIKGIDALKEYHSKIDDSDINLSWEPLYAMISDSGELGYSYGIWKLKSPDGEFEGTYVTIWKKNKNREWKLVLDTGNGGLGND